MLNENRPKTSKEYRFKLAGYEGLVYGTVTVPKGTPVETAGNLPGDNYWTKEWDGISEKHKELVNSIGVSIPAEYVD